MHPEIAVVQRNWVPEVLVPAKSGQPVAPCKPDFFCKVITARILACNKRTKALRLQSIFTLRMGLWETIRNS